MLNLLRAAMKGCEELCSKTTRNNNNNNIFFQSMPFALPKWEVSSHDTTSCCSYRHADATSVASWNTLCHIVALFLTKREHFNASRSNKMSSFVYLELTNTTKTTSVYYKPKPTLLTCWVEFSCKSTSVSIPQHLIHIFFIPALCV